jgi:hypothetical protein
VGPTTGMDDVEKRKILLLPGLELRPLRRSARSQSLYRLRYPGSFYGECVRPIIHKKYERLTFIYNFCSRNVLLRQGITREFLLRCPYKRHADHRVVSITSVRL